MSYMKLILVGNLGRDVDLKYTPAGKAVANFNVGVNEGYGEKKKTSWIRVTVWDKNAENCAKYLKTGSRVLCEGSLNSDEGGNPRQYDKSDGTTGCNHEMTAYRVVFLSDKETAQKEESFDDTPF